MEKPLHLKEKTCCFSGHRCLQTPAKQIRERLVNSILLLAQNGVRYFGAGGARGFDLLAAQAVLACKAAGAPVRLILVLPYWGMQAHWSAPEQQAFWKVLRQADKVVCLHQSDEGDPTALYKERNRHLVDNSAYLLCYACDYNSGTGYCVGRAWRSGVKIANLAEESYYQTMQAWFLPKEETL